MARIPRAVIDEVRNSVDIVDVIGRYVQLKKAGKHFTGLCPFHNEQTPSFSVNAEKQYYHCFGCGRSGNVFQFLMDYQHINFVEAVAAVAKDAGISLPEQYVQSSNHPAAPVDSETGQLIQLHQKAADLYHYILVGTPAGEAGLHYLTRRGVSRELIDQFQLGFAPEQQVLKAYCDKEKLDYQLLRKSGLFTEDREGQLHDRFANRVMYPIKNRRGQVIAFSGRLLSTVNTDLPKYLNSPETPIFNKRRTLFNLDVARKAARQDGKLYLFEGFMDFLSYLTLKQTDDSAICINAPCDHLIMNSISNLKKTLTYLQKYTYIHCYLDNDLAGQKTVETIAGMYDGRVYNESNRYAGYKDLNDYLRGKKQ